MTSSFIIFKLYFQPLNQNLVGIYLSLSDCLFLPKCYLCNLFFPLLILSPGESGEIDQRKSFVGFLGLYNLYVQIFRQVDKKFIKQIWEVHRKV